MNRIRELRRERGWTQADLAEKLSTKQQSVGRYETGERDLDTANIGKLCNIFGVTADYLLGLSPLRSLALSEEEWAILSAYRAADDDRRETVQTALRPWLKAAPQKTQEIV